MLLEKGTGNVGYNQKLTKQVRHMFRMLSYSGMSVQLGNISTVKFG
jgi:hypothetical protein